MRKHTDLQYAKALYAVVSKTQGKQVSKIADSFILLLQRDGALSRIKRILGAYESYSEIKEKRSPVSILTRYALDAKTKKMISAVFGKERTVMETVNERLSGGFRITDNDRIYDATLDTQLNKLYNGLLK